MAVKPFAPASLGEINRPSMDELHEYIITNVLPLARAQPSAYQFQPGMRLTIAA